MPFPLVTSLRAARVTLRPVLESDLPDLLEMNGDPEVTRYLPYAPWQSLEDAKCWLDRMSALAGAGTAQQLVIVSNATGRAIGTLLLFNYNERSSRLELGYALRRSEWGRGLMREAAEAACSHAFAAGIRRIEAEVNPDNAASCALLERMGFRLEGTFRQRWVDHGEPHDTNMYGCLSHEWRTTGASMTTIGLNHINFSGSRELLDQLKDFYCDVLGLQVGDRPNFPRSGYWLYAGGQPILHLYESAPGEVRHSDVLTVIDHVALTCVGRDAVEERLRERAIHYDKALVPGSTHVQLFVRDPAGTRVELNFDR